jgi:hypothetical protein
MAAVDASRGELPADGRIEFVRTKLVDRAVSRSQFYLEWAEPESALRAAARVQPITSWDRTHPCVQD